MNLLELTKARLAAKDRQRNAKGVGDRDRFLDAIKEEYAIERQIRRLVMDEHDHELIRDLAREQRESDAEEWVDVDD